MYVFYVSGRLLEAHLCVFYVSWRLWEAHLYVFYVSGRLSGGRVSNEAWRSCETGLVRERKTLTCVGGGGGGGGRGSICRVLRGSEALRA